MEDTQIIALYWDRNEDAIHQTDLSYGRKLHVLSDKIVNSYEDAQECVNDTYLKAWNSIPPQRPSFFFAYLAKICRFFSYGILDWRQAAKRNADVVELTKEMEMCIPDPSHQRRIEGEEIGRVLDLFLDSISQESRLIFMRRYWYTDSISEIAARYHISESKVKTQLYRTRVKLRSFLEQEGVTVCVQKSFWKVCAMWMSGSWMKRNIRRFTRKSVVPGCACSLWLPVSAFW